MHRPWVYSLYWLLAVSCILVTVAFAQAQSLSEFGKVELIRDAWGVPHVFAETDQGAMYGLGYACAEDRGYQMTYFLRMMQGRLAEVFGDREKQRAGGTGPKTTLEHDRLMRMFGFAQAAQRAVQHPEPETSGLLEAYSRGVNDYFAQNGHREH